MSKFAMCHVMCKMLLPEMQLPTVYCKTFKEHKIPANCVLFS